MAETTSTPAAAMRTQYSITRAMSDEMAMVRVYANRQREEMTRAMMASGEIVWPSVVEAPERKDNASRITIWTAHWEVANG